MAILRWWGFMTLKKSISSFCGSYLCYHPIHSNKASSISQYWSGLYLENFKSHFHEFQTDFIHRYWTSNQLYGHIVVERKQLIKNIIWINDYRQKDIAISSPLTHADIIEISWSSSIHLLSEIIDSTKDSEVSPVSCALNLESWGLKWVSKCSKLSLELQLWQGNITALKYV